MVLPLLAALAPAFLGGAIAGIGALIAPKPEPTVQTNSIDLKRLRADAEAAGFNPLTIIRGGGLSGFSRSEMSAAPDMRLSNAFSAFGGAIAGASWDPYGAARSKTELRLMEAQIADFARRGSAPSGMSFSTPKAKVTGDSAILRTTDGRAWTTGPGSPAGDVQQEYGELAGDLYGIERYLVDGWNRRFGTLGRTAPVSWGPDGWKRDPKGAHSVIVTGGGF